MDNTINQLDLLVRVEHCIQLLNTHSFFFLAASMAYGNAQARDQTYLSYCSDNTGSLTCCSTRELCTSQLFKLRLKSPSGKTMPTTSMLPFREQHFFGSLGPNLQHMEVPRRGVKLELQQPAYTTATRHQPHLQPMLQLVTTPDP